MFPASPDAERVHRENLISADGSQEPPGPDAITGITGVIVID